MAERADALIRRYEEWSPGSYKRTVEARHYLPGGDTRSSAHYGPYPLYMTEGDGCRIQDVDGHSFIDFMNNFTSLIHGHRHPPTRAAILEQADRGTAFAAPTDSQVELARLLCERVRGIDELRFCSSGTEATAMTIRAARAFTGKQKIMKMEGGYNGNHDIGELSMIPVPGKAGPIESPETVVSDRSLAISSVADVIVTPFNRPDVTRRQLEERGDEVAALILEPMLGGLGMIPPAADYLRELREITDDCEVLLVFDEVITLRCAYGGVQGQTGVTPDLTAMGKIIGGGLPAGAFGGRRDILEIFNPDRADAIMHASTFSGNPMSMAAGLAAMKDLGPDDFDRINALGARFREGVAAAFRSAGLRGHATGMGSLSHVHWSDVPVTDARASVIASGKARHVAPLLHLGMLRRGVFAAGRQMYAVSTPMSELEIDAALEAFAETLDELRPVVAEECPELLLA